MDNGDQAMPDAAQNPNSPPSDGSQSECESGSESDSDDEAQQKLQLQSLEVELSSNPSNYDYHVQYIRLLRKVGDIEKLRRARESMNELFPLTPAMWQEWAKDEASFTTRPEAVSAVEKLYERGVSDYLSVPLWYDYVNFVLGCDPMVHACLPDGISKARNLFERALTAAGLHVAEGIKLWEAYREFEQATFQTIDQSDIQAKEKQIQRIRTIFHRQLSVPLVNMSSTLRAYKTWEMEQGIVLDVESGDLDGLSSLVASAYRRALEGYNARILLEEQILRQDISESERLQQYMIYLKFEQSSGDPSRVQVLYERAVTEFPIASDLWLDYTRYLDKTLKVGNIIREVYSRATKNCPWVGELWVQYLLCLERARASEKELAAVFEKSLRCTFATMDEYLDLFLTQVDGLRRRLSFLGELEGELNYSLIRETFQSALDYLSQHLKNTEALVRFHGYWAHLELCLGKDLGAARGVWESLLKICGSMYEAWQGYIAMEIELGHINEARSIYKRCYSKRFSGTGSEDICHSWLRFEREFGALEDFDHAVQKVAPRLKELQLYRLQQQSKSTDEREIPLPNTREKRKPGSDLIQERSPAKRRKDAAQNRNNVHGKDKAQKLNLIELNKVDEVKANVDDENSRSNQQMRDTSTGKTKVYKDQCTAFISNLNLKANHEDLRNFFSDVGGVHDIRILQDKFTGKSRVYGLDINPRAVKVSWINLYLNALDEKGQPIFDGENKTLLDRVEFHESDLLSYCRDHNIQLERIVGCIPQILNPNPDAMSKMITENASEEFLFSLSNYCALQGFVEDQFGLGLIARAVEEGIAVIKPLGIMIFNMGGRPGQAVSKRLFERRGFRVTQIWQTKVIQAADTDISALVEIEKNSPHRFEFFMGLSGDQPICARTAWAYGKAGGSISHALSVYSCQLRQPTQVKTIFEFLRNGFHEISSSLDLSFEDDSVADEKIPILAYLATVLKESSVFPYEPPAGNKRFRNLIAGFMKTYHHIPLNADNVVVFPSRAVAIENALRLFSPRLAIVDEHLTRHLPRQWLTSLAIESTGSDNPSEDILTVIEAPRQSDLMVELIKKLKPQVVVTGMADFEAVTSAAFEHLLGVTREIGSRLFLDISDHFELSSLPGSSGVLKYLAGTRLPSHAAIICGLVKNQVYSDLEVAFIISEEEAIFKALSKTVEVLQGITAPMSQYYYGCLFHELLSFQLADRHPPAEREIQKDNSVEMIGFTSSAVSVLNNSELSVNEAEETSLIHMDVDQSFLPLPSPVKAAIFESFARQNLAESEIDVTSGIKHFIRSNYGFPTYSSTEFIYADSSLALFNKLVLCCAQEGGTLCFPAGSNGTYVSAAKFLKTNIVNIPTTPEDGFKLTEKILSEVLDTVDKPWVYISGPTINPTGLLYNNEQMGNILATCAKFGARVVIDTSFSGLEFDAESWGGWDLEGSLSKLNSSGNPSFCVSLLGGLSIKMLSGALKFGFLVLNQSHLVDTFYSFPGLCRPHSTVKYAIRKLLGLRKRKSGDLMDAVDEQIRSLRSRSKRLKETLKQSGWEVLDSCAGVSMVAKPSAYLNKIVKLKNSPKDGRGMENDGYYEVKLDDINIREAILKATGLCINSSSWTGIPGYCRLTIALEESEFERALECIVKFKEIINA